MLSRSNRQFFSALAFVAIAVFFARSPETIRWMLHFAGQHTEPATTLAVPDAPAPASPGMSDDIQPQAAAPSADYNTNSGQDDLDPLDQAVAAVPDSELKQALDASLRDQNPDSSQFRELLIRRWASLDPQAAAAWAAALPDAELAKPLITQVAIAWAEKDLSEASQWARDLPESPSRQAAVMAIGYEAARSNSPEPFDLVVSLPQSPERDDLLVHAARQWAAASPGDAVDWADQIQDSTLREQLFRSIGITAAAADPQNAAAFIATNLKPGPAQDQAAISIVQRWAKTDPAAAASWVSQFPDSDIKTEASAILEK